MMMMMMAAVVAAAMVLLRFFRRRCCCCCSCCWCWCSLVLVVLLWPLLGALLQILGARAGIACAYMNMHLYVCSFYLRPIIGNLINIFI